MSGARVSGVVALVLASVLWGTTGTVAALLPGGASPLAIGAATMGIGGALLFLTAPRSSAAVLRDPRTRRFALVGAVGVVVYPLAFYSGMDLVGVAVGNVAALGSGPVFAAIIESVVDRRRPPGRWFVATGIAIAGLVLLVLGREHGGDADGGAHAVLGVALGLLAGLAYAVYTSASSRAIGAGAPSRATMGGLFGVAALPLLVLLVALGAPLLASTPSVVGTAYLALGPMFVAYLLFGIGLRSVRGSAATTITLLEPVVATLLAVVVLGERLGVAGWIGFALILVGLTVLVTARRAGAAEGGRLESDS